jgi:hypothetical protein
VTAANAHALALAVYLAAFIFYCWLWRNYA